VQVLFPNVKEILKIKKSFLNISLKKIEEIHKTINNSGKLKPSINMSTNESSRQQIIIPIGANNISKFISLSNDYITNINRALKSIKSVYTIIIEVLIL